mgnify:CR=1 FL=1
MSIPESFYSNLAKRKNSLKVYNPYRDSYKLENLKRYFDAMFALAGPRVMLVGEAPGYKGCRLTGIPFSSGKLFEEVEHPFLQSLGPQLTLDQDSLVAENTASVVWRYLIDQPIVPLFWNSFPFHPHPSRIQKKNRPPSVAEIKEGAFYLNELVEVFQPDIVAGLGRAGTSCAQSVLPERDICYIRHPSYGGKRDFVTGMNQILNI